MPVHDEDLSIGPSSKKVDATLADTQWSYCNQPEYGATFRANGTLAITTASAGTWIALSQKGRFCFRRNGVAQRGSDGSDDTTEPTWSVVAASPSSSGGDSSSPNPATPSTAAAARVDALRVLAPVLVLEHAATSFESTRFASPASCNGTALQS